MVPSKEAMIALALFTKATIAITSVGCGPRGPVESGEIGAELESKPNMNKETLIDIAKQEAFRRGMVSELRVHEMTFLPALDAMESSRGAWSITLVALPEMPGGHAVVIVAADGRVLDYKPGR